MRQERAVEVEGSGFVRQSLFFRPLMSRSFPDCERANIIPDRFGGSTRGIFLPPPESYIGGKRSSARGDFDDEPNTTKFEKGLGGLIILGVGTLS